MIDEYIKALKTGEKEYKSRLAAGEYPYLPALLRYGATKPA